MSSGKNFFSQPEISIIIPAYQAEKTISQCLDGIVRQTFQNFEIIIVNDGSTDKTLKKMERFKKTTKAPVVLINQENKGANAARNRGFQASKGQFVIFCDADLIIRPDCLEKMRRALAKHPDASYAYSSFKFGWKKFKLWPFDAARLRQMPFIHTSSLIRREHFPGFDESIKKFQDWDLWLTMLEQGHVGVWIPEYLYRVVNTKGTMSQWLPSFLYRMPWKLLGFSPKAVAKYEKAKAVIIQKHQLL